MPSQTVSVQDRADPGERPAADNIVWAARRHAAGGPLGGVRSGPERPQPGGGRGSSPALRASARRSGERRLREGVQGRRTTGGDRQRAAARAGRSFRGHGQGRILVPNRFVVELSSHDHDRLAMYAATLSEELASVVREHAEEQPTNCAVRSRLLRRGRDLDIGVHRIRSSVVSSVVSVNPPEPAPAQPKRAARPPPRRPLSSPHRRRRPRRADAPGPPPTDVQPEAEPAVDVPRRRPSRSAQGHPGALPRGQRRPAPADRPVTVLGRGTQVDLRIDDAGVSRRHAEIRTRFARHAGRPDSTNGTTHRRRPIGEVELHDGAVISIGETELVFRRPATAGAGQTLSDE